MKQKIKKTSEALYLIVRELGFKIIKLKKANRSYSQILKFGLHKLTPGGINFIKNEMLKNSKEILKCLKYKKIILKSFEYHANDWRFNPEYYQHSNMHFMNDALSLNELFEIFLLTKN